jgi:hypothetical protein
MPLGVTLLELRRELRAETGTSLNPAQGVQAQGTLDIMLARQQRELWDAYNWQHLKMWKDVPLAKNQAAYNYPPEIAFDQITRMYVAPVVRDGAQVITGGGDWRPLTYGIAPHMMRLGPATPGTPLRWRNVATVSMDTGAPVTNPVGQFELLPMPATDDLMLRVEGQAPVSPLVNDTDTCILDSKAIVLFAAAEVMATQKNEAASMKLTKAQNYLRRLLADQGADKRANYNMGGYQRGGIDPDKARRTVPYIDYIPS